jgi:hypothetical protein
MKQEITVMIRGTKVLQQKKKTKTESKTNSSKELALVKKEAKKFG